MLRALFSAIRNCTIALEGLASSVTEANQNFRTNLGLDHQDKPEQLGHQPSEANGKASKRPTKAGR